MSKLLQRGQAQFRPIKLGALVETGAPIFFARVLSFPRKGLVEKPPLIGKIIFLGNKT
jgi:hypothetical protein